MSYDEYDAGREEYESEIARKTLEDEGVNYALENHFDEVVEAVRDAQAEEWLQESSDWLELVNIVSQHDREQIRAALRKKAYGAKGNGDAAGSEIQLFNVASDVSKALEALARFNLNGKFDAETDEANQQPGLLDHLKYGYRPGNPVPPLAKYAQHCNITDDLSWAAELVKLTRAFREILAAISDPQNSPLEWQLSEHIRTIDSALEKGTKSRLVYRGAQDRQHKFGREPNPATTPLSTILAEWFCDYLVKYSELISLGTCVECGKIFSRHRSDNAYCSKTCQNRVAYKRRKIFEGGLLRKLDVDLKTASAKLRPGVWVYHARLGLGFVDTVNEKYGTVSSISVRFPQLTRTYYGRDLFQGGSSVESDVSKIEFYTETDASTLAELL